MRGEFIHNHDMNALINTDIYNKRGLQHLSIFSDICAKGI